MSDSTLSRPTRLGIGRFWTTWDRLWFAPESESSFVLLRIVTFGTLLAFALQHQYEWVLRLADTDSWFYRPILMFEALGVGPMPAGAAQILRVILVVFGLMGLAGILVRLSSVICAAAYLYTVGELFAFTNVHHGHAVLALALICMAITPAQSLLDLRWPWRHETPVPNSGWPIRLIRCEIAAVYLFAGYAKLLFTGPSWVDGSVLRWFATWRASELGLWLADHPEICIVLSIGVLFWELSFAAVLRWKRLGWIYAPMGIVFHIVTANLLVDFRYFWPFLAVFLDPAKLRKVARRHWASGPKRVKSPLVTEV